MCTTPHRSQRPWRALAPRPPAQLVNQIQDVLDIVDEYHASEAAHGHGHGGHGHGGHNVSHAKHAKVVPHNPQAQAHSQAI